MNNNKIPRPKKKLGCSGRRFWRKVHQDYDFEDEHDIERLWQAADCLDQIHAASEVLKAEGMYILDRFSQKREHPALKTVKDFKALFLRYVKELNLNVDDQPKRPPGRPSPFSATGYGRL